MRPHSDAEKEPPPPPTATYDLSQYALELLYDSGEYRIMRGRRRSDGETILTIAPSQERPASATVARLKRSVSMATELAQLDSIVPLAATQHDGRLMILARDPGGVMLTQLIGAPMEVGQLLRIAVGLAEAVARFHASRRIHRDIKPHYVMVDPLSGRAWLAGAELSIQIPRQGFRGRAPTSIVGTLAYMAPERTGRTNLRVDRRSDLYSVGVTLYQMATGELPFTTADPVELVHCHLARQPVSPAERVAGFPETLSAIILKLLAKTPDERYQTVLGLERDLRRCLVEWQSSGSIAPFTLAERDACDHLFVPDKLYGRDQELSTLTAELDALDSGGGPRIVLISGAPGIGKTALLHELERTVLSTRPIRLISGAAEELNQEVPLAALSRALREVAAELLRGSETERIAWRRKIASAVGDHGRALTELVPLVEELIGPQPPLHELPPRDAERRFQWVLGRFIAALGESGRPVVFCLDSLQWTDTATLDFIARLMRTAPLKNLLFIGAYRNDQLTPSRYDGLRQAGVPVRELEVGPLPPDALRQLIQGILGCAPERALELAVTIEPKTHGSPFSTTQHVFSLVDEQLIQFDRETGRWTWDLGSVRVATLPESVVDQLRDKAIRFSAATRESIKLLACLGGRADALTLALALETSEPDVHASLLPAMAADLVTRQDADYRFTHDRLREAAYELIPAGERAVLHRRLGRLLDLDTADALLTERVFDIVHHFNRCLGCLADQRERDRVAELNLLASRKARASAASDAAATYADTGASLLSVDCWERRPDLAFGLTVERAQCDLQRGQLDAAEEKLALLPGRTRTLVDSAIVARLRMGLYTARNRFDLAIAVGRECLRDVGIDWPERPTEADARDEFARVEARLGGRTIESLVDLPPMADFGWRAIVDDVLLDILAPALFIDRNLYLVVLAKTVLTTLERGSSSGAAWGYTVFGMTLGSCFGDYDRGLRFGQLGVALAERQGLDRFRARVHLTFGHHILPWSQHISAGNVLIERAFETMAAGGETTFLAYGRNHMVAHRFAGGQSLVEVERDAESAYTFASESKFAMVADDIAGALALIRSLRGSVAVFGSMNDGRFDEAAHEQRLAQVPAYKAGAFRYWVRKLIARVVARDFATAAAAAARVEPLLWSAATGSVAPWFIENIEYHFHAALADAALARSPSDDVGREHRDSLRRHFEWLTKRASSCVENFGCRAALVAAEIARIESRQMDAERLYEDAIRLARDHGFVQVEALAYEQAAEFYAERGLADAARSYLQNARSCYARWGADGKLRQLEEQHPNLRARESATSVTATMDALGDKLDLAAALQASQAISSEIEIDRLIRRLMSISLVNAGAQRGLLFLARGQALRPEAEANTAATGVDVDIHPKDAGAGNWPASIVAHVARTHRRVLIDDALTPHAFSSDPYLKARRGRSLLCLPLVKQAELVGVLFLENNLATGTFTAERVALLELIAANTAALLDHARLFDELARENAERKNAEAQLEQRLAFERLISDLSTDIGRTASDVVANRVDSWLGRIATTLGIDRATFFEHVAENDSYRAVAFWSALSGADPPPGSIEGSHVPDAVAHIRAGETWAYERVRDVPDTDRWIYERVGIKSVLGVPAFVEGVSFGALILGACRAERAWSEELIQRVRVIGDIFANALARKRAERDRRVQHELAEALEFRELVMGILCHDLRSPLSAARGLAQLVARQADIPPDAGRRAGAITQSIDRMDALINTLLDFTETRFKGGLTLARTPTDLCELCLRVANEQMAVSSGRNVTTRCDAPLVGNWDPVRMEQIVSNLLANAFTHGAPKGPVVLSLKADGGHALIEVTNDGEPIPPDVLARLFEPFRRGPKSEPGSRHGLGLGLYIVRQIAIAHGGTVHARSTAGVGTVFSVRLPRE